MYSVTRLRLFQLGNKNVSFNNQIDCCYSTFGQTLLWEDNKWSENIIQQGDKKTWKEKKGKLESKNQKRKKKKKDNLGMKKRNEGKMKR